MESEKNFASVLEQIAPTSSVEALVARQKLSNIGNIMTNCVMEEEITLGTIEDEEKMTP